MSSVQPTIAKTALAKTALAKRLLRPAAKPFPLLPPSPPPPTHAKFA